MEKLVVNNKEYQVIKLLGKGKSGYSYLVKDNDEYKVIKQIHHEPCSYYQFGNKLEAEVNAYKTLTSVGLPLPTLYEVDYQNERILKQYIDGPTILDLVKNDEDISTYLLQMQRIADRLKENNINIDYFPTNFIVSNNSIIYVDYEYNNYMDEWNFPNWGIKYWSKTRELLDYLAKNPL